MNAKRLLKLAAFLDSLPPQKFDFGIVVDQKGKPMMEALKAGKTACGTVACAVGWLPAVFPRGFKWTDGVRFLDVELRGATGYVGIDPAVDFDAAAQWFGITYDQSEYLFMPGSDGSGLGCEVSPKRVAQHIRDFVYAS